MAINLETIKATRHLVVEHPVFLRIFNALHSEIAIGLNGHPQLVVGPTGVGKSCLLKMFAKSLHDFVLDHPELGYSPPLVLEVAAPENGIHSWKGFYIQALDQLNEPGVHFKSDLTARVIELRNNQKVAYGYHVTTQHLKSIYEHALRERRPISVIIDEAQHIDGPGSKLARIKNLDVIKGLSNSGSTTYVMFGTYELNDMLYSGAQLARRVKIHDFNRYRNSNQLELLDFMRAWRAIVTEFGIPTDPSLKNECTYLYVHSLGCIGVLITWFRVAAEKARTAGNWKVSKADLEAARLSNLQLGAMMQEIMEFEYRHQQDGDFDPGQFVLKPPKSEQDEKPSSRKKPGRIGIRKAVRDPVGIPE